jgi:hypothetical protein
MNVTKVFLVALIASLASLFTLRIGAGISLGLGWLSPALFAIGAIVSNQFGGGSIRDFFSK